MKAKRKHATKPKLVCKTISMPETLFEGVERVLTGDPELDLSKYVRRLIRADLESKPAEAT